MSFAFIFGYALFTQSGYFKTVYLNVQGCKTLDQKAVITQAKLSQGLNIFSVNLTTTRKRLLAHPWISEAEVSREIPSGIRIRIKEHEPLAIIDINRKFLLNHQGELFKEWEVTDPVNLPLVSGLAFSDLNVGARPYSQPFNAVMTVLRLGQHTGQHPHQPRDTENRGGQGYRPDNSCRQPSRCTQTGVSMNTPANTKNSRKFYFYLKKNQEHTDIELNRSESIPIELLSI